MAKQRNPSEYRKIEEKGKKSFANIPCPEWREISFKFFFIYFSIIIIFNHCYLPLAIFGKLNFLAFSLSAVIFFFLLSRVELSIWGREGGSFELFALCPAFLLSCFVPDTCESFRTGILFGI